MIPPSTRASVISMVKVSFRPGSPSSSTVTLKGTWADVEACPTKGGPVAVHVERVDPDAVDLQTRGEVVVSELPADRAIGRPRLGQVDRRHRQYLSTRCRYVTERSL